MSERDARTVAIIGGGGVGCAAAYFLAQSAANVRVIVIEKDPTYSRASTALAAGGIRQQFSTPENVAMSQFGYSFLMEAAERLSTAEFAADVGLAPCGYLTMASASGREALCRNYEMQCGLGADLEWLESAELHRHFAWLQCDDISAATLGRSGEGIFDPYALLQALRRKSMSLDAAFIADEVVDIERNADGAVEAVVLKAGGRLACDVAVNAAGPAAGHVARMAGIDLPVRPYRADTFVFRSRTPIPDCPVVIAPNGLHFRREGDAFICTMPRRGEWDDDTGDFDVDYGQFEDVIWPALAARVPSFEAVKMTGAWAGHLEVNSFDWNPVLGRHPQCANLIFANGFSGHGLQHLPAAGRAVSELILTGRFQTLDLERLGFDRILANRPLMEAGPH